MSRILATTAVFALLAAPAAARNQGGAQPASWAQSQIKVVVSHGLMANSIQTFHPDDMLTRGALTALVSGLTSERPTASTQSTAPVTMAQLDSTLVRGLELGGADPQLPWLGDAAGPGARRHLCAPHSLCLADANPANRRSLHRLSLHLGRHERERPGAARSPSSRWLRLLRIRLARLQASGLPRRLRAPRHAQGPDDLCDERRGAGGEADLVCPAEAWRRSLLGRRRRSVEACAGRPHRDLP